MVESKPVGTSSLFEKFVKLVQLLALIIVLVLVRSSFQDLFGISTSRVVKFELSKNNWPFDPYLGINKTLSDISIILRSHSPPTLLVSSDKSKFARENLVNQKTYATFITSTSILPALEVLLYSFSKSNPAYPMAVCVPIMKNGQELVSVVIRTLRKYKNIEWTVYAWPLIPPPANSHAPPASSSSSSSTAWLEWTQLQLWTMTQYATILYIDPAAMFLKNADNIFQAPLTLFKDTNVSGAFLLQPSIPVFSHLLEMRERTRSRDGLNEFLHFMFADVRCCLPPRFYLCKKQLFPSNPKAIIPPWIEQSITIVHFSGEKPWTSWSSAAFRSRHVPKKVRRALTKADQWDASKYGWIHDQWKEFYFKARRSEFKKFTMYQGYHRLLCWTELESAPFYQAVRLAGTIRSPSTLSTMIYNSVLDVDASGNHSSDGLATPRHVTGSDIDALELVPQLRSPAMQQALGEFGSMLAVSALDFDSLTPFVGFTSWRERVKMNWKEGASIDWTKVDFQENTLYFWYSIHSKNRTYYQVMDQEHPGMFATLKTLIDFPLPEMKDVNYAYANYFITTKEIFRAYMKDALKFTNRFIAKYPIGSKCPYTVPKDAAAAGKRCVGYILERYINVWAADKKLRMVYAVDHPEWRLK